MSIFGGILGKIFGKKPAPAQPQVAPKPAAAPVAGQAQPAAPAAPAQPVDVEAVLTQMADTKGGGGNWRTSIVDLLKLLDMDSSLTARKELAEELGVHAGDHGSAEQNMALSKAVWKKLAENGGKVPASLRD
ncbi:DUF3597 domain-containing protein [Sphingomonas sp.]|jgi:hypothetical protein|uniref:DUF3597 domain-containing protein n=1 Tax=Sphingomonas sp. TaxID=28214 RepID=UPI002D80C4B6|nr:DUF3597 domain-containing protein [Sphingomonas sp.]HEU0044022.1 DUF3597 domain-containing protein [Sphingomonas sp.]